MLQGVKLNETLEEQFSGSRYFGIINNFRQINTFVGVNNSGKSRFLRALFSRSNDTKFIYEISEQNIQNILNLSEQIVRIIDNLKGNGIEYKYRNSLNTISETIKQNGDKVLNKYIGFVLVFKHFRNSMNLN